MDADTNEMLEKCDESEWIANFNEATAAVTQDLTRMSPSSGAGQTCAPKDAYWAKSHDHQEMLMQYAGFSKSCILHKHMPVMSARANGRCKMLDVFH